MAVHEQSHRTAGFRFPSLRRTRSAQAPGEAVTTSVTAVGSYALAGLRLLTGFVFLWAFLDKAFGFGYA
ncbi:hypothetical protein ACIQRL_30455, partial [Streptomyces sp. NPDC091209]